MKKIGAIICSVLMLGIAFTGCSKKDKVTGPVTVEIWHTYNGQQAAALTDMADRFNASQSKYVVQVLNQDYSGFADTVYNAVANGVGPSIIFNYGTTAVDYANEDLAIDITKYINEDKKKGDSLMQDIIDSLPEAMKTDVLGFEDGGIYYLPGCTTGPVFFYNKTIFDELGLNPPKTWDELEAVAKTIYEKKGIPGFHSDGLVDNLQEMIMHNGLGYIDVKNKKVTFCTDKMVEIYQWYADMCKKGYFIFNTVGRYASEDLANGDIASFSGSCVNDQYIKMVEGKGELGMAPWIAGDFYTAWNRGPIFLHRDENVNRGAYEFVKFMLSPENAVKWAMANSALCPYGTSANVPEYVEYLNNLPSTSALPYVQANLNVSGSFPNVTGSATVRKALEENLNYVVDGKISAADAVKALEKACNDALNGR
ncbi:MAG: extracellular solute-binding protein [Treponema sp.]|nr:extracellular solute-binding protein [Treponema sp.]MCI5665407.1 extracellular solute-binding protein [Spirochaetia bacterium]MDD7768552.1 extracellular solute-binding protein [Treponema sp.]